MYEIFDFRWSDLNLMFESFMRYLIQFGLIKYLMVESFVIYLVLIGLIKYLTV